MNIDEIKESILNTLKEINIPIKKIILFGSRARGDYSEFSDYDFLIITEETLSIKEKMKISAIISRALAKLHIAADIIINSEEEVELKKNKIGYVTRYAIKEGKTI